MTIHESYGSAEGNSLRDSCRAPDGPQETAHARVDGLAAAAGLARLPPRAGAARGRPPERAVRRAGRPALVLARADRSGPRIDRADRRAPRRTRLAGEARVLPEPPGRRHVAHRTARGDPRRALPARRGVGRA